MAQLTAEDRAILEHEASWANRRDEGRREASARANLDLRPVAYFQRLNALLDQPAAVAEYPMVVHRLRRVRDGRSRGRRATAS